MQARISAIRSWAYIAQRPDWVLAKEEMAARARAAEAKLSDALHARLTERFVNRRTSVLMRKLGNDSGLPTVGVEDGDVLVEGEAIGSLEGLHFKVDPQARHSDRKLLLAAAEKHVPQLLEQRALRLAGDVDAGATELELHGTTIRWQDTALAKLSPGRNALHPRIELDSSIARLADHTRGQLIAALEGWLAQQLKPLDPLRVLETASLSDKGGPELRALLIRLVESGGIMEREGSGLDRLNKAQRNTLTKMGVRVGALDIFVPAMLRLRALQAWSVLAAASGLRSPLVSPDPLMPPALDLDNRKPPTGYRRVGQQAIRIDSAEKLLREAHGVRLAHEGQPFALDPSKAISMGIRAETFAQLLRLGGFRSVVPKALPKDAHGPPAPSRWRWRPARRVAEPERPVTVREGNAFAALAELVR